MTLEEAINNLDDQLNNEGGHTSDYSRRLAMRLGIEALEREQERREQGQAWKPLPSETDGEVKCERCGQDMAEKGKDLCPICEEDYKWEAEEARDIETEAK